MSSAKAYIVTTRVEVLSLVVVGDTDTYDTVVFSAEVCSLSACVLFCVVSLFLGATFERSDSMPHPLRCRFPLCVIA